MSDQLFNSITVPPAHIVDVFRLATKPVHGEPPMLGGWRSFLRHQIEQWPMTLLSTSAQHLEHFGVYASESIDQLLEAPWSEVVTLGVATQVLWTRPSLASSSGCSIRTKMVAEVVAVLK